MECGRILGELAREIGRASRLVGSRFSNEVMDIQQMVESARYQLLTEFDGQAAYDRLQTANTRYDMIMDRIIRR